MHGAASCLVDFGTVWDLHAICQIPDCPASKFFDIFGLRATGRERSSAHAHRYHRALCDTPLFGACRLRFCRFSVLRYEGEGKLKFPNGVEYVGQFHKGEFHGTNFACVRLYQYLLCIINSMHQSNESETEECELSKCMCHRFNVLFDKKKYVCVCVSLCYSYLYVL